MLLEAAGRRVTEEELVLASAVESGGLDPGQVAALARRYGLAGLEVQLELDDLRFAVQQQGFPIVFLYRLPVDRVKEIHAVVPIRFTAKLVTMLDPLKGKRRIAIQKFENARRWVDRWCVICHPQ
jgi:hypothetical protein